jgi:hypothetical protein
LHRETMSRRVLLFILSSFAWAGGLLISVAATYAGVDPDLFDGRMMTPPLPAESPDASGSEGASGETEQSAGEGAEEASSQSRDFSEIGGVTAGEAVAGESSKTGAASESSSDGGRDFSRVGEVVGGEFVDSASSKSGATTPSAGSGGGTSVDGATGGGSGGAPTERSFEDFGFGATSGVNSTVEVHDSKSASVPPPGSTSASVPSELSTPSARSAAGASTPGVEAGSGDYGSDLPSGL